jgi:preprotein translocase subunit SecG
MTTVILVIHIMIAAALVDLVLIQRSEGGALGIGGGGGGGFMSSRGAANLLTRMTAGLAAAFFATSLLLAVMASRGSNAPSILGGSGSGQTQPAPASGGGSSLPKLQPIVPATPSGPKVPQSQ